MTAIAPGSHLHSGYDVGARLMRVTDTRELTAHITQFRFAPIGGDDSAMLTPYAPGSHLIVTIGEPGSELRNAYSLIDDGRYPTDYSISVLRRGSGGGSDWLHDNVIEGSVVEVAGPRSMFAPVLDQRHALLIAAGIGITPILSHARAIVAEGRIGAEIIYAYRPGHAAHLDEIRALAASDAITVHETTDAVSTRAMMRSRTAQQPWGTHAYACGPTAMLEAYAEIAAQLGWPSARVHAEHFSAPEQDPGEPFSVRIASTGARIDVPSGVSLLQRLLDNGIAVSNLCRQGVCGECRIPVRAGSVLHRDHVLTDEERVSASSMMCCVSRADSSNDEIEIDL